MRTQVHTATEVVTRIARHPANRGRRVRALSTFVGWQAWKRATGRAWTIRLGSTMRLRCYPASTSASFVLYCRLPEWEDMSFLQHYLRAGDVFVDVGANVGVYSLLAVDVTGVRAYCFEPSPDSLPILRENIALNGVEDRLQVCAVAVGGSVGQMAFTVGRDVLNHLVAEGDTTTDATLVDVVTLDTAVPVEDHASVSLVKIDVEGAEAAVLEGAGVLLGSKPAIIAEANDPNALRRVLEPLGYEPYAYDPDARTLRERPWARGSENNLILLAEPEEARRRVTDLPDRGRLAAS